MMKELIIVTFCVTFLSSSCTLGQPAEDEITSLPGLAKLPKYKQYSGYLDATGTRHLHYWYVESQHDPDNDPVVLWLNGGPGCSSLDGLLSELGPLHVNDDGTTLYENPYSWNLIANVLFLEAPAGVGYSYADDKNYTTDDDQTAMDNYQALQSFFTKFPNRASNPFYIFGESYGGIYVPTLSQEIMNGNASINFQGFGVGNGMHDYSINANTAVEFSYYHGIFGDSLWNSLQKYCCDKGQCNYYDNENKDCQLAVVRVHTFMYQIGLNVYSIYMDCNGGVPPHLDRYIVDMKNLFNLPNSTASLKSMWLKQAAQVEHLIMDIGINYYAIYMDCYGGVPPHLDRYVFDIKNLFRRNKSPASIKSHLLKKYKPGKVKKPVFDLPLHDLMGFNKAKNGTPPIVGEVPPCINATAAHAWLNRGDVRKALHIKDGLPEWEICNGKINYTQTYANMYNIYKALLGNYRILIYHGDTDLACNFLGGQEFVNSLGQQETAQRRAWIYKNQIAGFVHEFDSITYMTVKGAGHMVPQWKAPQSLQMFMNFLNNDPQ